MQEAGNGKPVMIVRKEMTICSNCKYWEKDPIPYNEIYFGLCKIDGKIKYEFHVCDFKDMIIQ